MTINRQRSYPFNSFITAGLPANRGLQSGEYNVDAQTTMRGAEMGMLVEACEVEFSNLVLAREEVSILSLGLM